MLILIVCGGGYVKFQAAKAAAHLIRIYIWM